VVNKSVCIKILYQLVTAQKTEIENEEVGITDR
jgi:hypothetical protein